MKNYISKFKKGTHSKKGFSLMELIVAIIIIMLTVSAAIHGLNISYKSITLGAKKDDAQSIAQRDCDIIMTALERAIKNDKLNLAIDETSGGFTPDFLTNIQADTRISDVASIGQSYDASQYLDIDYLSSSSVAPKTDPAGNILNEKTRYVKLDKSSRNYNSYSYDIYKITVYVFYSSNKNTYVTCEAEVTVDNGTIEESTPSGGGGTPGGGGGTPGGGGGETPGGGGETPGGGGETPGGGGETPGGGGGTPPTATTINVNLASVTKGDERWAVYYWNGSDNHWMNITGSSFQLPDGYDNFIICRMKGSSTENKWDNVWNQTNNLTASGGTNIKATGWGSGGKFNVTQS